ncbi:DUF2147 domain-containing protein [Massilia sp. B-10]|nr:DUF2147 domain-containing protein [Massilia sp. B-10]
MAQCRQGRRDRIQSLYRSAQRPVRHHRLGQGCLSTPDDACGVMIAKLKAWDDDAWRNGWVHDPRTKKNYKGIVRVKDATLLVRAYIGTELLGETEIMTRAASVPPGCKAKQ